MISISKFAKCSFVLAAFLTVPICGPAYAQEMVGLQQFSFQTPHHDEALEGAVFYPAKANANAGAGAGADGGVEMFGENGVFYGSEIFNEATLAKGKFPIVLLSHGLGGNVRAMGWLATGLAKKGAIVVAVNHPHSSTFSFNMQKGLRHWTRAQDLSFVLDAFLDDGRYADAIDQQQIVVAGFSYGGWTALSLGGLTGNLNAYIEHCQKDIELSSHCQDIKRAGAELEDISSDDWNASYKDTRISKIIAVDPALHYGLNADNVGDISADIMMVALGSGNDRLYATNYDQEGSNFRSYLPDADYRHVVPAYHFSFLPTCKPNGAKILELEKDDPVCTDPDGFDRGNFHKLLIGQISEFIRQ